MTIAHEYVGVIVDKGNGVKNIQIGDRVTGEGHIACGHCRNCRRGKLHVCENTIGIGVNRDGAFAEFLPLPAENVVHLDTRIPDEMAAFLNEINKNKLNDYRINCPLLTDYPLPQNPAKREKTSLSAYCQNPGCSRKNVINNSTGASSWVLQTT